MQECQSGKKAIISVNIAVLLFGLVGLFAKQIHVSALEMTFWRVLFSSMALAAFMLATGGTFRVSNIKDAATLVVAGIILALHWWSFLGAIQISTVAIGTITFSSFPLFLTFLEPIVFRERISTRNIVFALLILAGVMITIPEFSLENQSSLGILVGMFSTFLYAVLAIVNKSVSIKYGSTMTAFYEQVVAVFVLFPLILHGWTLPDGRDIVLLALLGVLTTALAHTLFISSLNSLPVQLAGVISSMETLYGILFAYIVLGEVPTLKECVGAVVIIGTVLFAQLKRR